MKRTNIAIGLSVMMTLGIASGAVAAPRVVSAAPSTQSTQTVETKEKQQLTLEDAIKKAVQNNLNLKKNEIQRESLLKQIDQSYQSDQSIFAMKQYQDAQLNESDPNYEQTKREQDAQFQKAISGSDYLKATLINQRTTLDVSTIMERETVGMNINRLFTSIQQKEQDIRILERKIVQDAKNLSLYQKQQALGKISDGKLTELQLDATKNQNRLKVEKLKLSAYYRELENLTLLSNIERDYQLEQIETVYQPIELSIETQRIKEQSAADFSTLVSSKVAARKIAESKYENYPYLSESTTYVEVSDNKYLSQLEESQAIREAKLSAQTKYNNLQELQENIEISSKDITKLELQLKDLALKYKLGTISKNTYDNAVFSLDEAKNSLEALKTQHYQARQMYENLYFAGV